MLNNIGNEFHLENFNKRLHNFYMVDFLLINCQITSKSELNAAAQLFEFEITKAITDANATDIVVITNLTQSLPIVHYVYDKCKNKIDIYLSMTRFEPRLVAEKFEWTQVHLDACLRLLEILKAEFKFATVSFNRLFVILQLLSQYLLTNFGLPTTVNNLTTEPKLTKIRHQHQSLIVLRFFFNILEKLEKFEAEQRMLIETDEIVEEDYLTHEFVREVKAAYLEYFKNEVDFKTNKTICNLHYFIVEVAQIVRKNFSNAPEAIKLVEEGLNVFYVDIIDSLCFGSGNADKPDDEAINSVLKVCV